MSPLSISVSSVSHGPNEDIPSSRNKNRNRTPCGNCSGSRVRCTVSHPYSTLLCKRCKEDGLSECPPFVQRNVGKRRAPYRRRKRNPARSTEGTDASEIVFIYEKMPISNNTELSQAGSDEIANSPDNTANGSSQTPIVSSDMKMKYSVGYEELIPGSDIGPASCNIASTSALPVNSLEGSNADASINTETAEENELFAYNWFNLLNETAN